MKEKRGWWDRVVLLCLLLSALGGMFYYGARKEGYHVDELYSYGLANSEYLPFMHFGEMEYSVKDWMLEYGAGESLGNFARNLWRDYQILKENQFRLRDSVIYQDYLRAQANSADTRTTTWMSGRDYLEYLAVSESNRFNYASVYYNQRGDVHPPLFYMVLHTVSSLFPERFSKWFCLIPNFVFMFLSILLLYRIVDCHMGGKGFALATVAVFALSKYMVTTAIFLRMYALLTLMMLWSLEVHLELLGKKGGFGKGICLQLSLSTLLGYLTHYYFVLYVLMLVFVFVCLLAYEKRWKELLKYCLIIAGTALLGLLIWPFSIKHVFLGYRGRESLEILSSFRFSSWRLWTVLGRFVSTMWDGRVKAAYAVLIILAVLSVVTMLVNCIRGKAAAGQGLKLERLALLILPCCFYVLTASQIVPFLEERYFSCLYPLFCIFFVCGAGSVVKGLSGLFPTAVRDDKGQDNAESDIAGRDIAGGIAAGVMAAVLILFGNYAVHTPGYLFPGGQEKTEVPARCVCVYVLPDGDWNESANETNVLAKCEKVALL